MPPAPRRFRPAGKAARDQRLELGADGLREHRRGAVGRDADDKRRAVDDRAEGEIAVGRFVDHVDRDAGLARGARETLRLRVILERSDRDGSAGEIRVLPAAQMNEDRALRRVGGNREHLVAEFGREHVNVCAGGRKQLRLPGRRRGAAGQHHALAGECEEHWQPSKCSHARFARFSWGA